MSLAWKVGCSLRFHTAFTSFAKAKFIVPITSAIGWLKASTIRLVERNSGLSSWTALILGHCFKLDLRKHFVESGVLPIKESRIAVRRLESYGEDAACEEARLPSFQHIIFLTQLVRSVL